MPNKTLADKLGKIPGGTRNTAPHLIVGARAGTGKTTTLVEGLNLLKGYCPRIDPSPQQSAVWKSILLSKDSAQTVCFVAFNKSIATELQQRVPEGCDAMTMHSMGFRAIRNAFGGPKLEVNTFRVRDLLAEMLGYEDSFDLRRDRPEFLNAVEKLVSLCKINLQPVTCRDSEELAQGVIGSFYQDQLAQLAAHYDVDLNDNATEIFETVPKVLELCKDVDRDRQLDFDDMVWLPIVLNLNVYRYDLLLVDEAQDLNRCQQQLALKAGHRLILVGDRKQAIYGFAGADSESIARMQLSLSGDNRCEANNWGPHQIDSNSRCSLCCLGPRVIAEIKDRGCETLPLTVTRRCGRAIVKEAQRIVPDFEAHETCSDGEVWRARFGETKYAEAFDSMMNEEDLDVDTTTVNYRTYVQDGDMVLCRVNAPLVSECFKFLRTGRKANIQGRDIGQGLITLVNKVSKIRVDNVRGSVIALLLTRLYQWLRKEEQKENAKRNPSDARLIALHDRHDCIVCFTEDCETVKEVTDKIAAVFSDNDTEGIKLSSIHRAKGLEANRVFLLQPEGTIIPHPMARSAWQREQEMNLLYVAITRSIEELVYVS